VYTSAPVAPAAEGGKLAGYASARAAEERELAVYACAPVAEVGELAVYAHTGVAHHIVAALELAAMRYPGAVA